MYACMCIYICLFVFFFFLFWSNSVIIYSVIWMTYRVYTPTAYRLLQLLHCKYTCVLV